MYKGGFQLVDFGDVVLPSGTPETIKGVYSRIVNNNRKPYIACGLTVQASGNGNISALNDEIVNFLESEDGYTASLSNGGTLLVTSADAVTYTEGA